MRVRERTEDGRAALAAERVNGRVVRTQGGNNNAYCHDDESTWFDWSLLDKHADVHRFVTLLAACRLLRDAEHEERRMSLTQLIAQADQSWHGVKLGQPDWGEHSHSVAFTARLRKEQMTVHMTAAGCRGASRS